MAWSVRGLLGLLAACVAVVAVGYGGALAAPFVADDYPLWSGLTDGSTGLAAIGMRPAVPFVRPVLGLSFALDGRLFGPDLGAHAAAMRGQNFVLHALCAWLLGVVAQLWTARPAAALVAALLFASCPLHPEAVTWISARGYPLAGCFSLAALWYALARDGGSALARGVGVGVLGAAALFSVEPALPLVLYPMALLWATRSRRRGVGIALTVVTLGYLAVRVLWLGHLGGYRTAEGTSRHATFALRPTLEYLAQAAGHTLAPGPWDGAEGPALTIAIAIVAGAGLLLHGSAGHGRDSLRRAVALLACWLGALSVTANWATLGSDLAGCRYLYFASMFCYLGLAWSAALAWSAGGARRALMIAACAACLGGQLMLVRAVNARWAVGGELARAAIDGVVERVQEHGARHVFLFDPPASFRGAHALPWGMEEALAIRVGSRLTVDVLRDPGAFGVVRQAHTNATDSERKAIDVGAWDAGTRAWRWL